MPGASGPVPEQLSGALERGEPASFRFRDLTVRASASPQGAVLDSFFAGYDQSFVLPNEKEELDGFRECLALNFGDEHTRLAAKFGPFREIVLIAEHGSGSSVGGANFICYPLTADGQQVLALNLNYIYVMPLQRGKGHLRVLLGVVETVVRALFGRSQGAGPAPAVLTFLEQNDPLRLDAEAYALDSKHAGIDQLQRVGVWARMGARILDYPYAQPPLSEDQGPDEGLLYAVIGASQPAISACVVREHLARFFGISVLKGADASKDETASRQLDDLAGRCRARRPIDLLDATSLTAIPSGTTVDMSLRDLLRVR
jgi:hypothetical protein